MPGMIAVAHQSREMQTICTRDDVTILLMRHHVVRPLEMTYRMERHGALKLALAPIASPGADTDGPGAVWSDALFLPPGSVTRVMINAGEYITLSCFFPDALVREAGWDASRWDHAAKTASLAVKQDVCRLFAMLRETGPEPNSFVEAASKILLFEAIRDLTRVPVLPAVKAGGLPAWRHDRIRRRLADVTRAPPSVAELAAECGITPRHLARAFRADTGDTISNRIEQAMMTRARYLLRTEVVPIKRIAADLGFSSAASFAVAFARAEGVRPLDYRRRLGLNV